GCFRPSLCSPLRNAIRLSAPEAGQRAVASSARRDICGETCVVRPQSVRVSWLLESNLRPCLFELLLDLFGLFLRRIFLDDAGSAVDHLLCLFQAQAGDLADRLDNVDLAGTDVGQLDGE